MPSHVKFSSVSDMQFIAPQSELAAALKVASRAVGNGRSHPITANLLLTADPDLGVVTITGHDLSRGIRACVSASISDAGSITAPARLLTDIISRLNSDEPISLITTGNTLEIKSTSGSYSVSTLPAEDYPDIPALNTAHRAVVSPAAFALVLDATLHAAASDESKQVLTGVHLVIKDGTLHAASTDGHRLAVYEVPQAADKDTQFDVTIDHNVLRELLRLIGADDIEISAGPGQVILSTLSYTISGRLIDGTYPNVQQLIPKTFKHDLTFDRTAMLRSLERIAVVADQHNGVVKLATESGTLTVSAMAQDVGSASEVLQIDSNDFPPIALNIHYLIDGIKAANAPTITLKANEPTTPVVLTAESAPGFTYLVMPVQVRA